MTSNGRWARAAFVLAAILALVLAASAGGTTKKQAAAGPPIRLGYVVNDWTQLLKILNRTDITAAQIINGSKREMNALVAWANAQGGVGGRKIVAKPFVIDQLSNADQLVAACQQITQDNHEQVLIDQSIFTNEASWSCFASHHTDYVGIASATDSRFIKSVSPYIVTPYPLVDRQMQAMVTLLKKVRYFSKGKVGVILEANQPALVRDYNTVMLPLLRKAGINPTMKLLDSTNSAATNNAVLAFKSAGVDHVIGFITILNFLAFTNQAQTQGYHPRYAWGDYQAIAQVASIYGSPEQDNASVAVSSLDIWSGIANDRSRLASDSSSPFKKGQIPAANIACRKIISARSGVNYMNPGQAGASTFETGYCEHFMLWFNAARKVGKSWTPQKFAQGLKALGTFPSARMHELSYTEGTWGGPTRFAAGGYVQSCKCYVRSTPWTKFK
jgi:hypothetical protein